MQKVFLSFFAYFKDFIASAMTSILRPNSFVLDNDSTVMNEMKKATNDENKALLFCSWIQLANINNFNNFCLVKADWEEAMDTFKVFEPSH